VIDYSVRLRPARWWDRWFVLDLRNDPDTRAVGINAQPVGAAWWRCVKPMLAIITAGSQSYRVGYLIVNTKCEISIALSPTFRGHGLGTIALLLARQQYGPLTAYVKDDNLASQRAFVKAGFRYVRVTPDYLVYEMA